MNDASTDTGSARPVMTVERHEFRNRNTTSTVSSAPSTSASSTFAHRRRRRASPASRTTLERRRPAGSVVCDLVDCARAPASATSVVL